MQNSYMLEWLLVLLCEDFRLFSIYCFQKRCDPKGLIHLSFKGVLLDMAFYKIPLPNIFVCFRHSSLQMFGQGTFMTFWFCNASCLTVLMANHIFLMICVSEAADITVRLLTSALKFGNLQMEHSQGVDWQKRSHYFCISHIRAFSCRDT